MPISLDMTGATDTDVRISTSPLAEFGSAWHVLVADHHPEHADWAAQVWAKLPAGVTDALADWSFAVSAVRAALLADPTLVTGSGWSEQVAWIRRMPPKDFAASVLRPLARRRGRAGDVGDATVRAHVRSLARARGPRARRTVTLVLDEPEAARDAFADLLDQAWTSFFAREWGSAAPRLGEEASARSAMRDRDGWSRALSRLSPAVRVDAAAGRIVVDKVQNKRLAVAGRGLVLVPTVLGSGHLYVADEPGRPVVVHYPVPSPASAAGSRSTLRRLNVLAHPARLEVCRAIAVEPRSAREIARLWGMAESTVTKHLSALRAVGLVHSERAGHYVRYSLDERVITGLGPDLLDVLRR
ncbi:ArsR family transcriptional regulator [Haloactinopolyspora alba]|uniref:ArsR family transcriptional regulator n=1 Tax=Haloactinopolyspora alba TaxID=648780 RepID=A0A2P8EFE2_9ACTN|nr:DUF5937 family protein [Haloactinopolyspora alba]PSL08197.1 ArsR family transcriptional regulator [Haloactinopolyspora alba]